MLLRRKRKCMLIGLLMVLSALMFLLATSGGRPKPSTSSFRLLWVPSRVTYVTKAPSEGNDLPNGEHIEVVAAAKEDSQTAVYYTKDIAGLERILHKLNLDLKNEWRVLSSFEQVENSELLKQWPSNTVELMKIIKAIRKGINIKNKNVRTLDDMMDQVKILKNRAFPVGQRKDCRGCFQHKFVTYIHPFSVCSKAPELDLVILVTSKPENDENRSAIRSTWGAYATNDTNKVKLAFLFGKSKDNPQINAALKAESLKYHDILQDDYRDGYYSLAYKVISGLRWAKFSCSQARFFMVVADDVFVNVPAILALLDKYRNTDGFRNHIVGKCRAGEHPYRFPDHKDYISTLEYEKDAYPPYPEGSMFLVSNKLAGTITQAAKNTAYFPLGDVYLGLLMEQLGRGCHDVEGLFLPFTGPRRMPTQPFFGLHPVPWQRLEENYRKLQMHSLSSLYRPAASYVV